jgi:alpha-tubulin suppressor-like RCC1 family protein
MSVKIIFTFIAIYICHFAYGQSVSIRLHWIGESGNAKDTSNWSKTSGGVNFNRIPRNGDTLIFDANSFNSPGGVIMLDTNLRSRIFDFSALDEDITINIPVGRDFEPRLIWRMSTHVTFMGANIEINDSPLKIFSNGASVNHPLIFKESNISFQDDFVTSSNVIFDSSIIYGNENDLTASSLFFKNSTIYLDSSTVTITDDTLAFIGQNKLLNKPLVSIFTSLNPAVLVLDSIEIGNIITQTDLSIFDEGRIDTLLVSNSKVVSFENGQLFEVVSAGVITGSCSSTAKLTSNTIPHLGNPAILRTPYSNFYAATIDLEGLASDTTNGKKYTLIGADTSGTCNPAWNIITGGKYWVGGSGNWSDNAHWAICSGGIGGTGVPTTTDSVYFDQNSFSGIGQIITVDINTTIANLAMFPNSYSPQMLFDADLVVNQRVQLSQSYSYNYGSMNPSGIELSPITDTLDFYAENASFNAKITINDTNTIGFKNTRLHGELNGQSLSTIELIDGILVFENVDYKFANFIDSNVTNVNSHIYGKQSKLNILSNCYDKTGATKNMESVDLVLGQFLSTHNVFLSNDIYNSIVVDFKNPSNLFDSILSSLRAEKITFKGGSNIVFQSDSTVFADTIIFNAFCTDSIEFKSTGVTKVNFDGLTTSGNIDSIYIDLTKLTNVDFSTSVNSTRSLLTSSTNITNSDAYSSVLIDIDHILGTGICYGDTVEFSVLATNGITNDPSTLKYFWDYDERQYTGDTTLYIFKNDGLHLVSLEVTNVLDKCKAKDTVSIYMTEPKVFISDSDGNDKICKEQAVTFKGKPTTGGYEFEFLKYGTVLQAMSVDTNIVLSNLMNGDSIQMIGKLGTCYSDTISSKPFIVLDLPTPILTLSDADTSICQFDLVTFEANTTVGNQYQFFVNDSSLSSMSDVYILEYGDLVDNDTIFVIERNNTTLCTDTSGIIIFNVNTLPNTTLVSDVLGGTICDGDNITFTTSGADLYTFYVDSLIVQASSTTNFWSTNALLNEDSVFVFGTTINGCGLMADTLFSFVVNPKPITAIISSDSDNVFCSGDLIEFEGEGATQFEFFLNGISQNIMSTNSVFSSFSLNNNDTLFVLGEFGGCFAYSDTLVFDVVTSPSPVLNFDTNDTICEGESINFIGSGATDYSYFIADTEVQTLSSNPNYTSSTISDQQTVILIGVSNGCERNVSQTFTVLTRPSINIASNDPNNIQCFGDSITFNGGGAMLYELFVNGTSSSAIQASNTFTEFLSAGINNVNIIGTGPNGCTETSSTIVVTTNSIPNTGISSSDVDTTICIGSNILFTASGANNYTFLVDGSSATGNLPTNNFSKDNISNGQMISVIGNSFGCIDTSDVLTFIVNTPPNLTISSTDLNNSFCAGENVIYSSNGGTNYQIIIDGSALGLPSAIDTFDASGLSAGSHNILFTSENNLCYDTVQALVIVNGIPTVGLTDSDSDNLICQGNPIVFNATGGALYQYLINNLPIGAFSSNPSYTNTTIANGDEIRVVSKNTFGCIDTSMTFIYSVNPTPIVSLTSSEFDNQICVGESVTFTGTGATQYEFFVDNVSQGVGIVNTFTSTALTNGTQIKVRGTSLDCPATSSIISTQVFVYPQVNLNNLGDSNICVGELTNLIADGAGTYEFFVNGTSQGVTSPINTFTSSVPNNTLVTVIGTLNNCATTSDAVSYQVFNYPVLTLNSNDADNLICFGQTVNFTANMADSYKFFINGELQTQNTTGTYSSNTLHDADVVSVQGFNHDCASNIPNINLVVNTMDLDLTTVPSTIVCENEPINFTGFGGNLYEYFVNGVSQGAPSINANYTGTSLDNNDTVTFTAFNNITLCAQTYSYPVVVKVLPIPEIAGTAPLAVCEGDSVLLNSNSLLGNQWLLEGNPIAGATDNSYYVKEDGGYSLSVNLGGQNDIWNVGYNANGIFGNGNNFNSSDAVETNDLEDVKMISAGSNFMTAVLENGDVYIWGENETGQLGNGTFTSNNEPSQLASLSDIKCIATGNKSAMAVSNTGVVYVWGKNNFGQLGTGTTSVINFPFTNTTINAVDTIVAGADHFLFLKNDGTVWSTGRNNFGQLGIGSIINSTLPVQVPSLSNIVGIGTSWNSSFAINDQGRLFVWGNNTNGQLGLNNQTSESSPILHPIRNVQAVNGGKEHSIVIQNDGRTYVSGNNEFGQLGIENLDSTNVFLEIPIRGVVQSACGENFSLLMTKDQQVYATGSNIEHQISASVDTEISSFVRISDFVSPKFIAASYLSSHAIQEPINSCSSSVFDVTVYNTAVPVASFDGTTLISTSDASYQWYFEGEAITLGTNQSYIPYTGGNYYVVTQNAFGCEESSNTIYVGLANLNESSVQFGLYPNSSNGIFNVSSTEKINLIEVEIVDVFGKKISPSMHILEKQLQIDLSDFASGTYWINISTESNETVRLKLIKID